MGHAAQPVELRSQDTSPDPNRDVWHITNRRAYRTCLAANGLPAANSEPPSTGRDVRRRLLLIGEPIKRSGTLVEVFHNLVGD